MEGKFEGGAMRKKFHRHGGPEEIEEVIQSLEKTDAPLAEILRRHINPETVTPFGKIGKITPPLVPPTEKNSKKPFRSWIENSLPRGDRDEEN